MIVCDNLVKIYKTKDLEVQALQGLDLTVEDGEMIAIIGNSGSGKSTLLNMIGGLDKPSAGKLYVGDKDMFKLTERELVKYKRDVVGFVWQNNARNLIPYLNALENVELPMQIKGKVDRNRAKELLEIVGLKDRMKSRLFELSGGEQQRVAIAISLANNPQVLLADEPTGAVDTNTAGVIVDAFRVINDLYKTTIVIVTHDKFIAGGVDRVVEIIDGRASREYIKRAEGEISINTKHDKSAYVETHQTYSVVDSVGRIQLPSDLMELAHIENKSKVQVAFENDALVIRNMELVTKLKENQ